MANYYQTYRSSYFTVKNSNEFKDFINRCKGGEAYLEEGDEDNQFAVYGDFMPYELTQKGFGADDWDNVDEIDFPVQVAKHLVDDEVAIFMASGHEKHRYVSGFAYAVDNTGGYEILTLEDIYKKVEKASPKKNWTRCEY